MRRRYQKVIAIWDFSSSSNLMCASPSPPPEESDTASAGRNLRSCDLRDRHTCCARRPNPSRPERAQSPKTAVGLMSQADGASPAHSTARFA